MLLYEMASSTNSNPIRTSTVLPIVDYKALPPVVGLHPSRKVQRIIEEEFCKSSSIQCTDPFLGSLNCDEVGILHCRRVNAQVAV